MVNLISKSLNNLPLISLFLLGDLYPCSAVMRTVLTLLQLASLAGRYTQHTIFNLNSLVFRCLSSPFGLPSATTWKADSGFQESLCETYVPRPSRIRQSMSCIRHDSTVPEIIPKKR